MSSVKTPELAIAIGPLTNLLQAADKGVADAEQGKLVVNASNSLCRVVKTDVETRIGRAKALAVEAKLIEGTVEKQPERIAAAA